MGDRTSITLTFGGVIPQDAFDQIVHKVADLHDDYGFMDDEWGLLSDDLPWDDYLRATPVIIADEVNYGEIPELTDLCEKLGVSYDLTWRSGGSYAEGYRIFTPEKTVEFSTSGGEPVVTRSEMLEEDIPTLLEDMAFRLPALDIT